jgi:DNA-binding PadR family transcriptional regulator
MDMLILGMLALFRLTVYEIRGLIAKNFKDICSDSMGSIQAAIKKLLAAEMITYEEYVEKSVNKKRYSITGKGRQALAQWLMVPADISGGKNKELGKLLFIGLVPEENRMRLVEDMIAQTRESLSYLLEVQSSIDLSSQKKAVEYLDKDPEYRAGIEAITRSADMEKNARDIEFFQLATLEYGLDYMRFNIAWLEKLKAKMEGSGL